MSARTGKTRGYLAQLANPVLPDVPVFSARSDVSARQSFAVPQIPVIEDVIVPASRQSELATPLRMRDISADFHAMPAASTRKATPAALSPQPVSETTAVRSSTASSPDVTVTLSGSYVSPSASAGRQSSLTEHIEAAPLKTSGTSDGSALNATQTKTTKHVESPVLGMDDRRVDAHTFRGDNLSSTKAQETHPAVRVQPPAAHQRSVQADLTRYSHRSDQPPSAKSEQNSRSTPRVVIGTVEIRTRISQPAPQPAPAQQHPQEFSGQLNTRGGHSTHPDSLARSLAWNYGFIQG